MHYPDGNYQFLTGFRCTVKNNVMYVENGDVVDFNERPRSAAFLRPSTHTEDYSAWTTERRASVRQAIADIHMAAVSAALEERAWKSQIADAALAKLTPEEREAIAYVYFDDEYQFTEPDEPDYSGDCE